ncbi:MAG: hypothetical protein AAFW66_00100 [Pseudomonadota bacterium]
MTEDAKAPAEKKPIGGAATYEYEVQRDFWDTKRKRTRKGHVLKLTAEEAQDGIEGGTLKRVKKEEAAE